MEVVNARAALLSNYEVLDLLRELESEHLQRTKTALRIKKEEDSAGTLSIAAPQEDVCENLRTVEVEAIQYLSADYQPTASQSPASISQLVKDLAPYGLTKAEKLQVVNLAPTEPVELYVIVEELEDRLGDRMDDILNRIRASLSTPTPSHNVAPPHTMDDSLTDPIPLNSTPQANEPLFLDAQEDWDTYIHDEFDDAGEGFGVEGDLELQED